MRPLLNFTGSRRIQLDWMKKNVLRKIARLFVKILPFAMIAAIILAVACYPRDADGTEAAERRIVRVWCVDTFEGGKGSRTTFVKRVAASLGPEGGAYYLVSSYTLEGAETAYAEGKAPDALIFGIGLSAFTEDSLPLSRSFAGSETDEGCLAYPWYRGGYFLFSLTEDFEEAGNTVISCGGNNLPQVAAALEGIEGEEREALTAYVGFINGAYRYLLGTQRDICRLSSRGETFFTKALTEFNDLYGYFSVLSREKREDCFALLNALLSSEAQNSLDTIGMFPIQGDNSVKTVSVFSDGAALENMRGLARSGSKNLLNYLKNI